MKLLALLCLLFIGSSLAVRSQWVQLDRANPDSKITVRFALTQYNLDVLESTLLDRSNPKSANYGQWLSKPAILDIVAPSMEVSESVAKFLRNAGALKVENQRDVIKVFATVSFVEQLLQTTLHEFSHVVKTTRVIIRAVGGYQIPAEIEEHVDFVSGLFEFPSINKRQIQKVSEHDASVDGVDGYIVPYTIQNLYQIPASFPVNINSSICLAEFQDDASFNRADLKNFAKENAIPNINVTHIVGPYSGGSPDAESTLDVQYGGAISINTSVWFWTVDGWMYEFATDFYAATSYPLIVSMSWGWPEPDQCQVGNCTGGETSFQYVSRVNVEFQKIGLNGVTLLAASGDQGAPGDGNPDCTGSGKKALSTIFPGASPWVVSVGATMLTNNSADASDDAAAPPICKQFTCSTSTTEEVCTYPEALITTGGGFSNYVPTPSYQASAVSGYLNSKVALPPKGDFNASNRGFPDVSALGHNYLIDLSGQFIQVDGTSCSSPVFAAVIALINSARFNAGKSSIGFALPFLYGAPSSAYTDITSGNNKCTESCCSKIGYVATTGWDPVTGLGSPIFPKLLSYALSLP